MNTKAKAGTSRSPRSLATTKRQPVVGEVAARPLMIVRFVIGALLIAGSFMIVPELDVDTWIRWTVGGIAFVGGNVIRPLYRAPVRRKDQAFAAGIETIHFALVALAIAAAILVLRQFTTQSVINALQNIWVQACGASFFVLIALRDLLHRWRG